MEPTFRAKFVAEPVLSVQRDKQIVTASFTFPEIIFGVFMSEKFNMHLAAGTSFFFVGSKDLSKMQTDFDFFEKTVFNGIISERIDVLTLIQSLWVKTKSFIDNANDLFYENQKEFERNELMNAIQAESVFTLKGYKGKMFTKKQVEVVLEALQHVNLSAHAPKDKSDSRSKLKEKIAEKLVARKRR